MTTILKMDYHKIKSFDKKAIEVLDRVEATEALGFESKFYDYLLLKENYYYYYYYY